MPSNKSVTPNSDDTMAQSTHKVNSMGTSYIYVRGQFLVLKSIEPVILFSVSDQYQSVLIGIKQ